jgi:CheY-like chemotaxis protein
MSRRRILIVDDEEDIRSIIRSTLAVKYEVVEAQDGLDALAKLELAEPDFVVLDVMMPLMDGVATCVAIRRHPRFKDVSVLFLSALNTKEDMKKGYGAGANLYLTKPFDPSRLLRNVDLFFESSPPPIVRKRHTIEELREIEKQGPLAISKIHAEDARCAQPSAPSPRVPQSAPRQAPPAAPPAVPVERPQSAAAPVVQRPRVLVIDDDEEILMIIRASLGARYEVVTGTNGIEAIEKITSYQPDIILLDAMLPKMSGYQLCQSLRRNARFTHTPVLFVSAKCTPRDQEYAFRVGANGFVAKPFSTEELLSQVGKMQQLPTYVLHPKALNMAQIEDLENQRRQELQQRLDRLHRKQETDLERFMREQHEGGKGE